MSEIEKLYKNAGVEPQYKKRTECKDGYTVGHPCEKGIACINCNRSVFEDVMPPFTPEKQLELIKWWGKKNYTISIHFHENEWGIATEDYSGYFQDNLADALASIINTLWQDLTESEQEQIRSILNDN